MRACRALAFALALALELARGCRGLGLALGALLVCSVPWWLPPLAAAYADGLVHHPYATNSLTGGVVMLLGDSFAQFLEFRQRWRRWVRPQRGSARAALQPFAIDGVRLAACVCFSAGFHMPVNTWWYHHAVEKLLPDADLSLRLPGLGKPPTLGSVVQRSQTRWRGRSAHPGQGSARSQPGVGPQSDLLPLGAVSRGRGRAAAAGRAAGAGRAAAAHPAAVRARPL